jgi:hypothetical protein
MLCFVNLLLLLSQGDLATGYLQPNMLILTLITFYEQPAKLSVVACGAMTHTQQISQLFVMIPAISIGILRDTWHCGLWLCADVCECPNVQNDVTNCHIYFSYC